MVSKALNICMEVESSSNLGLYLDAFRLDYHSLGEIQREKFFVESQVWWKLNTRNFLTTVVYNGL